MSPRKRKQKTQKLISFSLGKERVLKKRSSHVKDRINKIMVNSFTNLQGFNISDKAETILKDLRQDYLNILEKMDQKTLKIS